MKNSIFTLTDDDRIFHILMTLTAFFVLGSCGDMTLTTDISLELQEEQPVTVRSLSIDEFLTMEADGDNRYIATTTDSPSIFVHDHDSISIREDVILTADIIEDEEAIVSVADIAYDDLQNTYVVEFKVGASGYKNQRITAYVIREMFWVDEIRIGNDLITREGTFPYRFQYFTDAAYFSQGNNGDPIFDRSVNVSATVLPEGLETIAEIDTSSLSYDEASGRYSFIVEVSSRNYETLRIEVEASKSSIHVLGVSSADKNVVYKNNGINFIHIADDISDYVATQGSQYYWVAGRFSIMSDPPDATHTVGAVEYNEETDMYSVLVSLRSGSKESTIVVQVTEKKNMIVSSLSVGGVPFFAHSEINSDNSLYDSYEYKEEDLSSVISSTRSPRLLYPVVVTAIDEESTTIIDDLIVNFSPAVNNLGIFTFTISIRSKNIRYAPKIINAEIIKTQRIAYKYDSHLRRYDDVFSIGDLDNERLLIADSDHLQGLTLKYSMSIMLENQVVYSVINEEKDSQEDGSFHIGLPALSDEGFALSPSSPSFEYDEYRAGSPLTISISDITNSKGETVIEGNVFDLITGGDGFIYTWRDLQNMRFDLSGNYILQHDITFPEYNEEGFPAYGFRPIGDYIVLSGQTGSDYQLERAFRGSLDGANKRIIGFKILSSNASQRNYLGLFGFVDFSNATHSTFLRNITFVDPYVQLTASDPEPRPSFVSENSFITVPMVNSYVGILAGGVIGTRSIHHGKEDNDIEISNVYVTTNNKDRNIQTPFVEIIQDTSRTHSVSYVGGLIGASVGGVSIRFGREDVFHTRIAIQDGDRVTSGGAVGGVVGFAGSTRIIAEKPTDVEGYVDLVGGYVDPQSSSSLSGIGGIVGELHAGMGASFVGANDSSTLIGSVSVFGESGTGGMIGTVHAGNGPIEEIDQTMTTSIRNVELRGSTHSNSRLKIIGGKSVGGILGEIHTVPWLAMDNWKISGHVSIEGNGNVGGYIGTYTSVGGKINSILHRNTDTIVRSLSAGNVGGVIGYLLHDSENRTLLESLHFSGQVYCQTVDSRIGSVGGLIGGSDVSKNVDHPVDDFLLTLRNVSVHHENADGPLSDSQRGEAYIGGVYMNAENIESQLHKAGGFIGEITHPVLIENAFMHGYVHGLFAGGLVGNLISYDDDNREPNTKFRNIRVAGQIIGGSVAGGLIGLSSVPNNAEVTIETENIVLDLGRHGLFLFDAGRIGRASYAGGGEFVYKHNGFYINQEISGFDVGTEKTITLAPENRLSGSKALKTSKIPISDTLFDGPWIETDRFPVLKANSGVPHPELQ